MSKRLTNKEFIILANKKHNHKFEYSLVNYLNSQTKVDIICSLHGVFSQIPAAHLSGQGCPKCNGKRKSTQDIIEDFKKVHNDNYDYSLVTYKGSSKKVDIICSVHGMFKQTPNDHLGGHGCSKCGKSERLTRDIFINRAEIIHNNKFDYSLVKYKNVHEKVKIICPIHGIFEQIPKVHLEGFGCKNCNESRGEKEIANILKNKNITFLRQYSFIDCRCKLPLPFDFYLPKFNICIEFQGIQHYQPIELFGGEKTFMECKIRDQIKENYCKEKDITLITIKYTDDIKNILEGRF